MHAFCTHEDAVFAAHKAGHWDEETSNHVSSCAVCSEMIRLAQWTGSLGPEPNWPKLRDPDLLWMEAHILKEQAKQERTVQLFVLVEVVGIALVSVCATALILNRHIASGLYSNFLQWITRFETLDRINLLSTTAAAAMIVPLMIAVTFLIYPFFIEE
jgi:hypothetical protein